MSPGRTPLVLLSTVLSLLIVGGLAGDPREPTTNASPEPAPPAARVTPTTLAKMPLRFEANAGQHDPTIRYVARRGGTSIALRDDGAKLVVQPHAKHARGGAAARRETVVLELAVDGGRSVTPQASGELVTRSNYFVGSDRSRWRTDVPNYAKVTYPSVLDGVDLVFHGEDGALEYDFVVAPGASVDRVAMSVTGAEDLRVTEKGELRIETESGVFVQPPPVAYQVGANGERRIVRSGYRLTGPQKIAFAVSAYDRAEPLVIDPVLGFSTYLGGSDEDTIDAIAADANGNTYVTGYTASPDFPTTNAYDGTPNPPPYCEGECLYGSDAFVAKLDEAGAQLLYATYLGGTSMDRGRGIAIGLDGTAYVTGVTASWDFPTVNPVNVYQYGHDAFVARLGAAGDTLVYSTYLSGTDDDEGKGIAVDATGIYVVGDTYARNVTLPPPPPTRAAAQTTVPTPYPSRDTFFVKLTPSGNAVTYVNYLGGTSDEYTTGFAVDGDGRAYVAGTTYSTDFPQGANPLGQGCAGGESSDAFVARLAPLGQAFEFATCLGGTSDESGGGLAVDSTGSAYVVGRTSSTDFPTGGAATTNAGGGDVFVTKLAPSGAAITYARYLGGSNEDGASAVALDGSNGVWVTGSTSSANFPTLLPIQATLGGGGEVPSDAFVTHLDAEGELLFSTFLGGAAEYDEGSSIAVNGSSVHVAGNTWSSDFPLFNPRQTNAEGQEGFVARLSTPPLLVSPPSVTLKVGEQQQFAATGGAGFGYTFSLQGNPSGANITSSGLYTAGAFGGVVDVVRVTDPAGTTATANVTVQPNTPPTVALAVHPTSANVPPRAQRSFTASGGLPPYAFSFASNASGGSLTSNGIYTAGPNGNVTDIVRVTDSAGTIAQATIGVGAKITVTPATPATPPNGSVSFSATGGSGSGYVWSIAKNGSGGAVNATSGTYKAGASANSVDTVQVVDSLGNQAQVNVSIGGGLAVSPAGPSTTTRGTIEFTAAGGSGSYTWSLTDAPSGATIDVGTGKYVAGTTGNTTDTVLVQDTLGNKSAVKVTVGPGLVITPPASTVVAGATIAFAAQGGSGAGYVFALATNESEATLNADGLYTAGPNGGTDIVHLTDSLGSAVDATITVAAAPGPSLDGGVPGSPTFDAGAFPGLNIGGGGANEDCSCRAVGGGRTGTGTAMGGFGALAAVLGLVARRRRRS